MSIEFTPGSPAHAGIDPGYVMPELMVPPHTRG